MTPHMRTAGVRILDVPYHADIEYTYYIPESFPEVSRGDFLLVPFGAGNKKIPAVVITISSVTDYRALKPVFKVFTDGIRLTEKMMRLADFLCGRTFCSFGEAVKRMVPSDLIPHANEYFSVCESAPLSPYAKRHAALIAYIEEHGSVSREKLTRETGVTSETLKHLCAEGVLQITARPSLSQGTHVTLIVPDENADTSVLDKPRTPQSHIDLYSVIAECGAIEKKTLLGGGWIDEGIAWYAPVFGGDPVYRLVKPDTNERCFTLDTEAVAMMESSGWLCEGICWGSPAEGDPVYRMYDPALTTGGVIYTASEEEKLALIGRGWVCEDVCWHCVPAV